MMRANKSTRGILLNGLNGGNPLGFLAAVGAFIALHGRFPGVCLGWKVTGAGWRPVIVGCGERQEDFLKNLSETMQHAPTNVFGIDNCLPFMADKFSKELERACRHASTANRRAVDFLASFGIDLYPDEKKNFQYTKFRMVRRADSVGNGFLAYARKIREDTDQDHLKRAIFDVWDYQDNGRCSLRWDPAEYQRYALRWQDPSQSRSGIMLAAYSLAIESLQILPTLLRGEKAETTGFRRFNSREYFVWPIWTPMLKADIVRSLLALPDLGEDPLPRTSLSRRGIEEVYCSRRISERYYLNFLPAKPAI